MLEFVEEGHIYTWDGDVVPSVSQIIRPLADYSAVPKDLLERAALFGTAVHSTVKLYLEGDLDEDSLDVGLDGPLRAFKRWQQEHPHLIEPVIERPMYHSRLKFAGTPDLIYEPTRPGHGVVVDLKTRPTNRVTDPIQCAAYQDLWQANDGKKPNYEHRILELKQSGEYVYTKVNDPQAIGMFRTLLDHYRAGQTIEAWRDRK